MGSQVRSVSALPAYAGFQQPGAPGVPGAPNAGGTFPPPM